MINLSSSLRCCECSASLSRWYYEKDGRLFCRNDYWARFGELCHGCNDPIATGLIMVNIQQFMKIFCCLCEIIYSVRELWSCWLLTTRCVIAELFCCCVSAGGVVSVASGNTRVRHGLKAGGEVFLVVCGSFTGKNVCPVEMFDWLNIEYLLTQSPSG